MGDNDIVNSQNAYRAGETYSFVRENQGKWEVVKLHLTGKQSKSLTPSEISNYLKSIPFNTDTSKRVDVSIDQIKNSHSDASASLAKIRDITARALPTRRRTAYEIGRALLQSPLTWIPVVNLFYALGLAVTKIIDTSKLKQPSLNSALNDVKQMIHSDDKQFIPLKSALSDALSFAEAMESSKRDTRQQAIANAMQKITSSELQTVIIPGGFWKDGSFQPALWTFSRDTSGYLQVEELTYGEDTGNQSRVYSFGAPADPDRLKELLTALTELSAPPETLTAAKPELTYGSAYLASLKQSSAINQRESESSVSESVEDLEEQDNPLEEDLREQKRATPGYVAPLSSEQYRSALFNTAGASPTTTPTIGGEEASTQRRRLLRDSPIKLVQEMLRTQFPDVPMADKLWFTVDALQQKIGLALKAVPDMTPGERDQWLLQLTHDRQSLEYQMEKAGVSAENQAALLSPFLHSLSQLEERVKTLNATGPKSQAVQRKQLNHTASSQSSALHVTEPKPASSESAPTGAVSETGLNFLDRSDLSILSHTFTSLHSANAVTSLETLNGLTERMDKLVEDRDYAAAIELYHRIMLIMPEPDSIFWGLLTTLDAPTDAIEPLLANIDSFTTALGKLTQGFWESKLRTEEPLQPEEAIYLLSGKAALLQLMRKRKNLLLSVALPDPVGKPQLLPSLPDQFSRDETRFLNWMKIYEQSEMRILKEAVAKIVPTDQPDLSKKLFRLKEFVFEINPNARHEPTNPRSLLSLYCAHIERPKGGGGSYIPLDPALVQRFFDRSDGGNSPTIPVQFPEMMRIDLMLLMMISDQPALSVTYGHGSIAELKDKLRGYQLSKLSAQEAAQQQKVDVHSRLERYPRLEIAASAWDENTPIQFGVRNQNAARDSQVQVAIKADGVESMALDAAFNHPKDLDRGWDSEASDALDLKQSTQGANPDVARRRGLLYSGPIPYANADPNDNHPPTLNRDLLEVFDQLLKVPSMLDDTSVNAQGVVGFETQKQLYWALYSGTAIDEAIRNETTFLEESADELSALIQQCMAEGRSGRLLPLLFYADSVHVRLQAAIKQLPRNSQKKLRLSALEAKWPKSNSWMTDVIKLMAQEPNEQIRIDNAAYFLSLFRNAQEPGQLESIDKLTADPNTQEAIMKAGALLNLAGSSMTIPVLGKATAAWFNEQVAPLMSAKALGNTGNLTVTLPLMITQHADYQSVFGSKLYSASVSVDSNGAMVYRFRDDKSVQHDIVFNRQTGDVQIHRAVRGKEKLETFYRPKSDDTEPITGFLSLVIQSGLWIHPDNKRQGMAFVAPDPQKPDQRLPFSIEFNRSGQIERVMHERLEVVTSTESLRAIVPGLPAEYTLFLRRPGSSVVTEIRCLNPQVTLQRPSKKGSWVVKNNARLADAQWVHGADIKLSPGSPLKALIPYFDQTGLTVRKGESTFVQLWPKEGTGATNQYSPKMTFDGQSYLLAPVTVEIKDSGEIITSAAGFLQLAYLSALSHNYSQAAEFLERARGRGFEHDQELDIVRILQSHFGNLPKSSARSAAIQVKAFLEIRRLLSEKVTETESAVAIAKANADVEKAYATYLIHNKRSPFSKNAGSATKYGISFSEAENQEIQRILQQSLHNVHVETVAAPSTLQIAVPTAAQVNAVLPSLLQAMAKPVKNPQELLDNLGSPQFVIEHFFEIYQTIISEKWTPYQLQALYRSFKKPDVKAKTDSRALGPSADDLSDLALQQYELARALLLSKASFPGEPLPEIATRPRLLQLKKQLPTSGVDLAVRTAKAAKEKPNRDGAFKSMKLTGDVNDLCDAFTPARERRGKVLSLQPAAANGNPVTAPSGRMIDVPKLADNIADDQSPFSPAVNALLQEQLSLIREFPAYMTAESFYEEASKLINRSVVDDLHRQDVQTRIRALESPPPPTPDVAEANAPTTFSVSQVQSTIVPTVYWAPAASDTQLQNVDRTAAELRAVMAPTGRDLLKDSANANLLAGVDASAAKLETVIRSRKEITTAKFHQVAEFVETQLKTRKHNVSTLTSQLIEKTKASNQLPSEIQQAVAKAADDPQLIHLLKKYYQSMSLTDSACCDLLTRLLLEQAAVGALTQVKNRELATLKALYPSEIETIEAGGTSSDDWLATSTRLIDTVNAALNFNRYVNADNEFGHAGDIHNDSLLRKALVLEASKGLILTPDQLDLVNKMAANPDDWYELKVGLGKTSVVFPLVLLMLIESGQFPTAVVKEELMQTNLESLDRSTRELIENAGVEFRLDATTPMTSLMLEEQYVRLLEVKARKGYPITSNTSIIAIDQRMKILNDKIVQGGVDDPDALELEQSLETLGKMRKLLGLLIYDEVDDICNILNENNLGSGADSKPHLLLQTTMEKVMNALQPAEAFVADVDESDKPQVIAYLKSPGTPIPELETMTTEQLQALHAKQAPLVRLYDVIHAGSQAALTTEEIKGTLMPALARTLLRDSSFLPQAADASENDIEALVKIICHVASESEAAPALPEWVDASHWQQLNALQQILQERLPLALGKNPDIDVGIQQAGKKTKADAEVGFQQVPYANGRPIENTVLSDQRDLVVSNYLAFAVRLPARQPTDLPGQSFVEKALARIKEMHRADYTDWETAHEAYNAKKRARDKVDLITFLNLPENQAMRLMFLRLSVFEEERLKVFEKQFVSSSQDPAFGRRVGGMTGTLNRASLPFKPQTAAANHAKTVTAQVILEAAVLAPPTVKVDKESNTLQEMRLAASDTKCKAIINQGHYLEGGDARALVKQLRDAAQNRPFVYVDSNDGKTYLWETGLTATPRRVSPKELEDLNLTSHFRTYGCYFYAPSDTRGRDFVVPPGRFQVFLGPRCSMDDAVQTLGRARQSGKTQGSDFHITEGIRDRIQKRLGDQPLDESKLYAYLIDDISWQDVESEQGKNLKTALQEMRVVVAVGTRDLIYGQDDTRTVEGYWEDASMRTLNRTITAALTKVANLDSVRTVSLNKSFGQTGMQSTESLIEADFKAHQLQLAALDAQLQTLRLKDVSGERPEVQTWYAARLQTLATQLEDLNSQLIEANTRVKAQLNAQNKTLPTQVPSSGAGVPSGQMQQQQQVQQQQQQQQQQAQEQQQQTSQTSAGALKNPFLHPKRYELRDPNFLFDRPEIMQLDGSVQAPCQSIWHQANKHFKVSDNFIDLWTVMSGGGRDPTRWRFAVKGGTVTIISRDDERRMTSLDYDVIYTWRNGQLRPFRRSPYFEGPVTAATDDRFQIKFASALWCLGVTQYTPEQKKALASWLYREMVILPTFTREQMTQFLSIYGSGQTQLAMLDELLAEGESLYRAS